MRTAQRDSELAAQSYASGLWVRETLADALATAARDTPRREVLVDGSVRLNCETLHTRANELAAAMSARMASGSVVSFMLPNWHEAAIVYHAATVAGMVANPILPSLRDHELAFILADADVRMIFIPAEFGGHDYAAMLQRVTTGMPSPPTVVVVRGQPQSGQVRFDSLEAEAPALPATLDPDAVRMILYTSGTTGRPKGVLHSQNSIHALIRQLGEQWRVEPGSVYLVPSPIAHIGGSIYAFEFPILLDTTAVLMDRWDPDAAVALMVGERCTHMSGATPFLQHLLGAAERAGTHLPDLKVFICGGASVPPALIRSAAGYFDSAVVTRVYGSTEVPVITVGADGDLDHAADTDGRPGIADVVIAGDGEIRARGPQMLLGYLHPEDEAEAFDADGYFRTGDLGHWVDDHFLVVTGRAKDIVIRNGENIAPKEVEDVLLGHPDIREIAIVGIPDPRTGERACAVVVADTLPGPGIADLRDFLQATGVAKFKWPEQVAVWDSLPKNDAGKILKHRIRARLVEADG
ncbi:AMP-binding protein [Mycobacterium sp. RTGN5]|uniref:AMP-binding protein n=1 Tax=Mycobacterium sp. RTGN5 TaxID=3016522 RepID=UPI0029C66690|nr:AMP-binding protein [Mycobacterium sp. RTGN5]